MHRIRSVRLSSLFFALLLLVLILLIVGFSLYGSSFVASFVSNWLSTLLGVVVGILAAIWIRQYPERNAEGERKQKVISLIREELQANHGVLKSMTEEQQREQFTYVYLTLRDDLWKAQSASGGLSSIQDPAMIGRLSNSYRLIRIVADLSEKYYQHAYLNSLGEDVRSVTRNSLCAMTLQAVEMVEGALEFMDPGEN